MGNQHQERQDATRPADPTPAPVAARPAVGPGERLAWDQAHAGASAQQLADLLNAYPRERDAILGAVQGERGNFFLNEVLAAAASTQQMTGVPQLKGQHGNECGAASLAAHLAVQDLDSGDRNHAVFAAACQRALADAERKQAMIKLRRGTKVYSDGVELIASAQQKAIAGDLARATELLALALFGLYGASGGMGDTEAGAASAALGTGGPDALDRLQGRGDARQRQVNVNSFEELFDNAVVTSLEPGEAAQTAWRSQTDDHYFVIGRRPREGGQAYYLIDLADQLQLAAATLPELRGKLERAMLGRRSHLQRETGERSGEQFTATRLYPAS